MLSKGLKCLYFAILICCVLFILSKAQNDHSYTFAGDAFTYDEETTTLYGPYVSLWNGNYGFELVYQTESDKTLVISTDRNLSEEVSISAAQKVYEKDFSTGRTDLFRISIPNVSDGEITIEEFTIYSDKPLYTDTYLFALLALLIGIALFMILNSKKWSTLSLEQKAIGFILVGITVFACYPFFTSELPEGFDTWGHLLRIESIKDAFFENQIPVSVFPKNCNGYGQLGTMYPLILLYPFGFLRKLHVSLIVCYKFVYLTATVATVLVMFYSMKTITKSDYAALVAAGLYCIAPYRMEDVFCRHAMGEVLAIIFVPLVIAGLYHIFVREHKKYWPVLMIGYSGVIQSHIISVVLVAFISIVIGILFIKSLFEKSRFISLLKALGLTVLLNIWYIVPFITQYIFGTNNNILLRTEFADSATILSDLISEVRWRNGVIGIVGIACILGIVICLFIMRKKKEKTSEDRFIRMLFVFAVILIFMTTVYFPWDLIMRFAPMAKLLGMIQFPFRLLVVAIPMLYMVSGYVFEKCDVIKKYRYFIFAFLIILTFIGIKSCMYGTWNGDGEKCEVTGGITNIAIPENYPQGADEASSRNESWYPYSYEMKITDFYRDGSMMAFNYMTPNEGEYVDFPRYYFVGYTAEVIGGELKKNMQLPVEQGAEYRIRVHLPKSELGTSVRIFYTGTWYFKIAYAVSIITLIVCLCNLVVKKEEKSDILKL